MRVRNAVACGIALLSLAGCSPDRDRDVSSPRDPTAVSSAGVFPQPSAVAAFVASFRTMFPALADGRSDEAIASEVTRLCIDDLQGPSVGHTDRDAAALQQIPSRFRWNEITPDWTTSNTILAMAKGTVCSPVHVS